MNEDDEKTKDEAQAADDLAALTDTTADAQEPVNEKEDFVDGSVYLYQ